ncbi:MAG: Rossmann-like and DUF2520 domain-containing protein [Pseudomonadota bacterium]
MSAERGPSACLIGAGRAGGSLALAWHAAGQLRFAGVVTRSGASAVAEQLDCPAYRDLAALRPVDVWVIATPDDSLPSVASALARTGVARAPATAFHLSGAATSDVLAPLAAQGVAVASAHPVRSFPRLETVLSFEGTHCALEGETAAVTVAGGLFTALGGRCFDLHADGKAAYHGAAVLANNGLVGLADAALTAWQTAGVPSELATGLFSDLATAAIDNLVAGGPRAALSGPLVRGDTGVVSRHCEELDARDPLAAEIYRALSRRLLQLASDRLDADTRDALKRVLESR